MESIQFWVSSKWSRRHAVTGMLMLRNMVVISDMVIQWSCVPVWTSTERDYSMSKLDSCRTWVYPRDILWLPPKKVVNCQKACQLSIVFFLCDGRSWRCTYTNIGLFSSMSHVPLSFTTITITCNYLNLSTLALHKKVHESFCISCHWCSFVYFPACSKSYPPYPYVPCERRYDQIKKSCKYYGSDACSFHLASSILFQVYQWVLNVSHMRYLDGGFNHRII